MKFNWDEKIGEFNLRELREFLKKFQSWNVLHSHRIRLRLRRAYLDNLSRNEYHEIEKREDILTYLERYENETFQKYITALKQGDLVIESSEEEFEEQRFELTELGRRLIKAKITRHSRAAAQKQLDLFVARCRAANAAKDFDESPTLLEIKELAVFGSFLEKDRDEVGDVDVYINIAFKKGAVDYLTDRGIDGIEVVYFFDKMFARLRKGLNIIDLNPSKEGMEGVKFEEISL